MVNIGEYLAAKETDIFLLMQNKTELKEGEYWTDICPVNRKVAPKAARTGSRQSQRRVTVPDHCVTHCHCGGHVSLL